jgi:hypothetical protein
MIQVTQIKKAVSRSHGLIERFKIIFRTILERSIPVEALANIF